MWCRHNAMVFLQYQAVVLVYPIEKSKENRVNYKMSSMEQRLSPSLYLFLLMNLQFYDFHTTYNTSIFLRDTLMLPTSRRRQWADDHNGRLLAVQQMRMPIFRLFCNTVNAICTVCRRRLFHFQINMPPNLRGYWVNRALLSWEERDLSHMV